MNKFYFIVATILLSSCMKADWEPVKTVNSNVSIKFPGKPIYKTITRNTPIIGRMKFDSYRLEENDTVFFMQISEPLETDISKDSLYDSTHAIKRAATKSGRKIINEYETSTFGYDTYMISTKTKNGGIMHNKVIKIKNKQYTLSVYYKNGKENYSQVEQFFNSFSI